MQFENKSSKEDVIPVKLTVPEAKFIVDIGTRDCAAQQRNAYLEMLRKIVQARHRAVGDQLPESVAALPLIVHDIPSELNFVREVRKHVLAERELGRLEAVVHGNDEDRESPHVVAVELTANEIDMIGRTAATTVELAQELDSTEAESTPSIAIEARFSSILEENDIARGIVSAIAEYRN